MQSDWPQLLPRERTALRHTRGVLPSGGGACSVSQQRRGGGGLPRGLAKAAGDRPACSRLASRPRAAALRGARQHAGGTQLAVKWSREHAARLTRLPRGPCFRPCTATGPARCCTRAPACAGAVPGLVPRAGLWQRAARGLCSAAQPRPVLVLRPAGWVARARRVRRKQAAHATLFQSAHGGTSALLHMLQLLSSKQSLLFGLAQAAARRAQAPRVRSRG